MKNLKLLFLTICLGVLSPGGLSSLYAQCPTGTDIHIANDISGSVDSREFQQSKDFVSLLGANFGTAYGTGNLETRVSISNWSAGSGRFVEYDFPSAGQNYATTIGDILSYTNSSRPFRGGTDVYTALLRAREWVNQNPVSGRDVPKVIVLLTDASCGQVANNTSSLATQIKNQGVYIVVLAIDNAAGCTNLSGTNVASPGGYFNAADYATLSSQAIAFINSLRDATCDPVNPPPPAPFDLSVSLSNFTITGCDTTPSASANLLVTNNSSGDDFSDNLQVSFYNGDPTNPSTQYLFTESFSSQTITSGGGTYSNTVNNAALISTSTLYAVVNYDGASAGNAVPLSYSDLANEVSVSGEGIVNNNISSPVSRTDGTGCLPFANLDVKVNTSGVGCDDETIYTVEVCNTGTADATEFNFTNYAPASFSLIDELEINGTTGQPSGNYTETSGSPFLDVGYSTELANGGNIFAVGGADANLNSVDIYEFSTTWTQRGGTLTGTSGTRFGHDIAMSSDGNILAVGAPESDVSGTDAGQVTVYEWNGTNYVLRAGSTLNGSASGDRFGEQVRLSDDGNVLAISAPQNDNAFSDAGNVSVYDWNGSGWTPRTILNGYAVDVLFGTGIDLSADGNTIAVGAPVKGFSSTSNFSVRVYTWSGATWTLKGNVLNTLPNTSNGSQPFRYGKSVSLSADGNIVLPGFQQSSFSDTDIVVFEYNGTSWVQRGATNINTANFHGLTDMSASGNVLVIGEWDLCCADFGELDIYSWDGTSYILLQDGIHVKFDSQGYQGVGQYTCSISRNASTIASGAPLNNDAILPEAAVFKTNLIGDILEAGACATYQYTYNINGSPAATYDFSVDVNATADTGDDPVQYSQDIGFSVGDDTGLNGFDGSVQSTDDLSYSGTTVSCDPGDQITVSVEMTSNEQNCAGDFSTATVTIDNGSGLTLSNTLLNLDLTGTDVFFSGEPYNKTNGLVLAEPNIFDPAYPAVPNALSDKTGAQTLEIFNLPDGISTFDIEVVLGPPTTDLSVEVTQIPTSLNASGATNMASASVNVGVQPEVTLTCPAGATATDTTISIPFTATGASTITWRSGSDGTFAGGSPQVYNINDIDRANGFVEISAEAQSVDGCLALASCRIDITGSVYDFGDAPLSYDFGESALPVAAASTINPNIYLGSIVPDAEANSNPTADASGDGADEDGLTNLIFTYPNPGQTYTLTAVATNNSTEDAYLYGFIDWNGDGDFLADPGELSTMVTVPAGSGTSSYAVEFSAPAQVSYQDVIVRLRLSTDEFAAARTFGASANGEIEDHVLKLDTDGDEIPDEVDIDDDNDGILDTDEGTTTIGTIETPINVFIDLDSYESETTWTLTGPGGFSQSGGPYTNADDIIDLNFAVTTTGTYTFTINDSFGDGMFYTGGSNENATSSYRITLAGNVIFDSGPLPNFGNSDTVNFTVGIGPDVYVDIDTDGDGIPDRLDLDSDGDGIADIIEAGGEDDNNDGEVDYPTVGDPTSMVDANNNGWSSVFDNGSGDGLATENGTPLTDPNTDGDTDLPNRLDLDSDNDGIPDNVEAQTTVGYIPPSGTFDRDGFDTAYAGGLTPVDTEGDGTPDYLDSDSDDDGLTDLEESFATTPVPSNGVGDNGLSDDAEAQDDYTDVSGNAHDGTNFALLDTDGDMLADGSNASPMDTDFDYRDDTFCFELNVHVYLEGSVVDPLTSLYTGTPMRTSLNDNRFLPGQLNESFLGDIYFPPGQPYNTAPWNYAGTEGDGFDSGNNTANADANYPATVVDWVLVSLRTDPTDGSQALFQRAALLHEDGRVEFVGDGACFELDASQSYYLVIEHRNHLIVMSDSGITPVDGVLTYDFRDKQSYIINPFLGPVAQKEISPGIYAMYAGNAEQASGPGDDTNINSLDELFRGLISPQTRTYNVGDFNMNGEINAVDRLIFTFNSPIFTSVPRN